MFILIRAAVYSSLFIGFLLVFLPAAALLGAATYYGSATLAGYALAFLIVMEVFVRLYEEPTLRRTFGAEYEEYCGRVGRWLPHRPNSHIVLRRR
jgi:protein-S-isoprenylcysteine O-methyltransferase Ste14